MATSFFGGDTKEDRLIHSFYQQMQSAYSALLQSTREAKSRQKEWAAGKYASQFKKEIETVEKALKILLNVY